MKQLLRLVPLICLLLIGCASRNSGWENTTESVSMNSADVTALKKQAMDLWKGRVEQGKLEEALAKFKVLHSVNPNDLETLVYLTRGNYFLADSHLQDIDQKKNYYEFKR